MNKKIQTTQFITNDTGPGVYKIIMRDGFTATTNASDPWQAFEILNQADVILAPQSAVRSIYKIKHHPA